MAMRYLCELLAAGACALLLAGCTSSSAKPRGRISLPKPPKVKTADPRTAPFLAGKQESVYHKRHCPYASTVSLPQGFATSYDAERTGHTPCAFCSPQHSDELPPAAQAPQGASARRPAQPGAPR